MKNIIVLILIATLISCKSEQEKKPIIASERDKQGDNVELIEIYKNDQLDRSTDNIDWSTVSKRDEERQLRIYELLDAKEVRTSLDFHNAAMVFQHGNDSVAYGMAVKLMKESIALDSTADKWLLAAAIDRDLLSRNKPQIYGTQYHRKDDEPWVLAEIDTTQITDEERIEYGVETLAQQREKVKQMNRKKLSELFGQVSSIDELIQVIKKEDLKNPEYDLSEGGINSFGYALMRDKKDADALKIFKLNTELYPNGFNTFDSYGECLLKMGDVKNGIIAYEKSLTLNPKNTNAEKIINEHKK